MRTRLLTFALLLGLSVAAAACSGQSTNAPPIIDTVDAPLAVGEQNGAYTIPVTVLFHDRDGEAVTHVRYRLGPTIEGTVAVTSANPTRESAEVAIVITTASLDEEAAQSGPDGKSTVSDSDRAEGNHEHGRGRGQVRSLQLSIVDGRGAESLPQSSTITLE